MDDADYAMLRNTFHGLFGDRWPAAWTKAHFDALEKGDGVIAKVLRNRSQSKQVEDAFMRSDGVIPKIMRAVTSYDRPGEQPLPVAMASQFLDSPRRALGTFLNAPNDALDWIAARGSQLATGQPTDQPVPHPLHEAYDRAFVPQVGPPRGRLERAARAGGNMVSETAPMIFGGMGMGGSQVVSPPPCRRPQPSLPLHRSPARSPIACSTLPPTNRRRPPLSGFTLPRWPAPRGSGTAKCWTPRRIRGRRGTR